MNSAVPRRRVVRPIPAVVPDPRRQIRTQRQRDQLAKERAALDRWMGKLRRAFHAVERQQRRIARLERRLGQLAS
jgi:hypothetical protein